MHQGQGAPISPIYHKYIIEKSKLRLPCAFFNIGGITNLSYWDGKNLIGYDVGPGNVFLDNYMTIKLNKNYDDGGVLASRGKIIANEIKKFFDHKYFNKPFPKSLDKNSFSDFFLNFISKNYSHKDAMATLTELTALSIFKSVKSTKEYPSSVIVSGGSYKNKFLLSRISNLIKKDILDLNSFGFNQDFTESELVAFLSARRINNLPITFPNTTGVKNPLIGGKILFYKNLFDF